MRMSGLAYEYMIRRSLAPPPLPLGGSGVYTVTYQNLLYCRVPKNSIPRPTAPAFFTPAPPPPPPPPPLPNYTIGGGGGWERQTPDHVRRVQQACVLSSGLQLLAMSIVIGLLCSGFWFVVFC